MVHLLEDLRNLAYRKKSIPEFTLVIHFNIGPNTYYGHRLIIVVTAVDTRRTQKFYPLTGAKKELK
jgi:hypothetical protein